MLATKQSSDLDGFIGRRWERGNDVSDFK